MRKHSVFSVVVAVLLTVSTIVATGLGLSGTAFAASSGSSLIWQTPALIDSQPNPPNQADIAQVSCPTATFCGMVTLEGSAYTWNGSTWQSGGLLGAFFGGVSCPSTTFCLAVGMTSVTASHVPGYAIWNGSSWSTMQAIPNPPAFSGSSSNPQAVSCASATFCVAGFNQSYVATWNGSTWTFAQLPGFTALFAPVVSISCPSTTFCAAAATVGDQNAVYPIIDTWNGSAWTTSNTPPVSSGGGYGPVACASATMCVAAYESTYVGVDGPAAIWNGTSWSTSTNSMPATNESAGSVTPSVAAISCPTSTFCGAIGDTHFLTIQNDTWGSEVPFTLSGENTSISCPTATMCVAGSGNGYVSIYQDGAWGAAADVAFTPTPPTPGMLTSVSCPTNTFCAAVDQNGNVVTYNGTSWSTPQSIDGGNAIGSISCPSTTFCAALDEQGNLLTWQNGTWTSTVLNSSAWWGATAISCTGTMNCVALSDGEEWSITPSAMTQVVPSGSTSLSGANAISCPTATWCMMDGYGGFAAWTNPVAGTITPITAPDLGFTAVSCSSTTQCVLTEPNGGQAVTWNGTSMSAPTTIDASNPGITSVSCPSATDCVAVVSNVSQVMLFARRLPGTPTPDGRVLEPSPSVGPNGWAISYNGTSWGTPVQIDSGPAGDGPQSVSCSTTQCVAVDLTGNEIIGTAPPTTCPPLTPTITISGGGGQSAEVNHAFTQPLTASVTCNGKPDTAPVTWATPSSGASGTVTSTGADTATVVANGTTGTWKVTAAIDGVSTTATLTNVAIGAAACSPNLAIRNGGQVARVGATFADPLVVTATCGSSPIPDLAVDVVLAPDGGHYVTGSTSAVVVTNTAGTATTPVVVATTNPETWMVTAHTVNPVNTANPPTAASGSSSLPATGVLTATATLTNAPSPVTPAVVNSGHPGPPTRSKGYIDVGGILLALAAIAAAVTEIERRKRKAC